MAEPDEGAPDYGVSCHKSACVCVYVCMYVCMYVCVHTHTHTHTHTTYHVCIYIYILKSFSLLFSPSTGVSRCGTSGRRISRYPHHHKDHLKSFSFFFLAVSFLINSLCRTTPSRPPPPPPARSLEPPRP